MIEWIFLLMITKILKKTEIIIIPEENKYGVFINIKKEEKNKYHVFSTMKKKKKKIKKQKDWQQRSKKLR